MDLKATVAVVTGGGTGIGRATALALARAGCRQIVVTYSRSAEQAQSLVDELAKLGVKGGAEKVDVSDDDQVRAMADRVLARCGRLDVLVNSAGTTRAVAHTNLEGLTDDIFQKLFAVNVLGPLHCVRAFAPALAAARGAVVNISSISAQRAAGSSIAYGVTKAALSQLTRNLAVALAPEIRVNTVAPGTVATRWQTGLHGVEGFVQRANAEAAVIPLGKVAQPEDVADAVLGVLKMDMVTGESVILDGGKHVRY